jgi:hypothetical protein
VEGQEEVIRKKKNKTLRGEARRQNLRELLVCIERERERRGEYKKLAEKEGEDAKTGEGESMFCLRALP